jgi:uncharacterized integral membrane protein
MKSLLAFLKFLCLVGFVCAGFVFALRNPTLTGLWLGVDFAPRPLGLWLLLAFACGGLLGLLLGTGISRSLRAAWRIRRLEARLQACQQELAAARHSSALPPPGNGD